MSYYSSISLYLAALNVSPGNSEAVVNPVAPVSFKLLASLSNPPYIFLNNLLTIVLTDCTTMWDTRKFHLEKETVAFLKEFSSMNRSGSLPPL